jgi:hypothetical protein
MRSHAPIRPEGRVLSKAAMRLKASESKIVDEMKKPIAFWEG